MRWGNYPGFSGLSREELSKRWRRRQKVKVRGVFYIATLLMLKMEEGTVSQEMQAVSRNWRKAGN